MNSKIKDFIKILLFIIYLCILLYIVLFAESMGRMEVSPDYRYNLKPLAEIRRYWNFIGRWDSQIGRIAFVNIFGNILVFMPFGLFLPWISNRNFTAIVTIIYGAGFSLAIELSQLVLKIGSFDVDDLLLNVIGTILGFIFYYFFHLIKKAVV